MGNGCALGEISGTPKRSKLVNTRRAIFCAWIRAGPPLYEISTSYDDAVMLDGGKFEHTMSVWKHKLRMSPVKNSSTIRRFCSPVRMERGLTSTLANISVRALMQEQDCIGYASTRKYLNDFEIDRIMARIELRDGRWLKR